MTVDAGAEDRCPYSRDFRQGFEACPAFEPTVSSMADSTGAPLGPVLTCRHLVPGTRSAGRFYPRCALGGPEQVGGRRRQAIRTG